jgi:hypothetical protein
MKTKILITAASVLLATIILAAGCQSDNGSGGTQPKELSVAPQKGGAELWAENCSRCHNLRPPQSYNDAQWETVVQHMRLRANLDGSEARLIAEFLKASH